LSLKLGKFGVFIGCSNYPECRYTRQLSAAAAEARANGDNGQRNGAQAIGKDGASGLDITLRDGRFGPYLQLGDGEKPKRVSLPKGIAPTAIDLPLAAKLLSLPREVARHPETGEPILAGIGRYGPYVQHGRTYANLDASDDVLQIGPNRAIDLIVARETRASGRRFGGGAPAGRPLGDHPDGGAVTVRPGRFGPYVNHGKLNATLPNGLDPDAVTLDGALALLAEGGGRRGRETLQARQVARRQASQPQTQIRRLTRSPRQSRQLS